ncbi:MAG: class I SAM-dependent methyltransferase [Mariprofundaceae bacterium]|nr:class I SAM-dependent methyltransferase [Mariprofundaceae bacterium]
MQKEQRKRIIDKHRDSLTRYGHHANALYWSSREIQEIRFRVLAEIGIESGDLLLDVGCGFGDLKRWFDAQGTLVNFTGIDLSPDLIRVAQEKHPNAMLLCGELDDFDFKPKSFDWVVLSGALNEQLHDDGAYARKTIASMFALCRNGLAFNLLDARSLNAHDLQSFLPQDILDDCKKLCANVRLIDDYLDNDFTIYMRRG